MGTARRFLGRSPARRWTIALAALDIAAGGGLRERLMNAFSRDCRGSSPIARAALEALCAAPAGPGPPSSPTARRTCSPRAVGSRGDRTSSLDSSSCRSRRPASTSPEPPRLSARSRPPRPAARAHLLRLVQWLGRRRRGRLRLRRGVGQPCRRAARAPAGRAACRDRPSRRAAGTAGPVTGFRGRRLTLQRGLGLYFRDYGDPLSPRAPLLCLTGLVRKEPSFADSRSITLGAPGDRVRLPRPRPVGL